MSLLTFRDTKGSPLTSIEADANVRALAQKTGTTPQLGGAVTGTGKYNSPLVSADGTAGMQAAINSFDEGGEVELGNALHKVTAPLVITTPATGGHGLRAGFNRDPNASVLGLQGTRVQVAGTFAKWGNTNDGERLGNNGWEKTYFYGDYSGDNSIVHRFEGRLDQPFFTRNHYSNFSYVYFMPPGAKGGNLDTATFQNEDALYNHHVFYDDGSRPSFFVKWFGNCYSDNFGYAIYVGNTNRPTADLLCQEGVVQNNTFARNALNGGASVELAMPGARVEGNNFRDTGWNFLTGARAVADCLRLRGASSVVTKNIFRGNLTGRNIVVDADDCQVLFNSFAGDRGETANGVGPVNSPSSGVSTNKLPIHVLSGRKRTIISEPTLRRDQLKDEGQGTLFNGLCVMSGDPDQVGPWVSFPKPDGSRFFDAKAGVIYEYSLAFSGGRRTITGVAAAATPQAGANQINWFTLNSANGRNVNCTTSLAADGTVTLTKTAGGNGDTASGAVSKKAISTANDPTIPAFTLTVNNTGIGENYARYIGLVAFADIGTKPNGERALEMPYRLYYDQSKFLVAIAQANQPTHNQVGSIQLVGYAQNDPNIISRLDLVYNGSALESYPNLSIALPLAIDTRLDFNDAYIKGATLTAQTLIDTPS